MTTHRRAILRIYGPDIQQDTVEVEQTAPLTVGRLEDNDLALKHSKVSRNHARFVFNGETMTVEDLDSANGTLKGEQRLEPNQAIGLAVGESVTIGPFSLFFDRIEEATPKPPSVPRQSKPATPPPPAATKQTDALETPAEKPPKAAAPVPPPAQEKPIQQSKVPVAVHPPAAPPPSQPPSIQPPPAPPASTPNGQGNGLSKPLVGVPTEASSWMQYLPEVYSESDFFKRFLLIFEAGFAPYEWIVDNMDMYFDAKMAPPEWLQWFGQWVDIWIPSHIPEERQHALAQEMGMLFKSRGTRKGLARHLELVFGKLPDILEPPERFATFVVRLPLGRDQDTAQNRMLATQIIESHRPIHTRYQLIIE